MASRSGTAWFTQSYHHQKSAMTPAGAECAEERPDERRRVPENHKTKGGSEHGTKEAANECPHPVGDEIPEPSGRSGANEARHRQDGPPNL